MTPMPEVVTVTRFQCPHCRKRWSRRKSAVEHIARCWYNPDVRSCKTCEHRIEPCHEPEVGYHSDEGCGLGIDIGRDPENSLALPLHCESWARRSDGAES